MTEPTLLDPGAISATAAAGITLAALQANSSRRRRP